VSSAQLFGFKTPINPNKSYADSHQTNMEDDMHCPHCLRAAEVHEGLDPDARPECARDGAASICWICLQPSVFTRTDTGELTLRRPTSAERAEILAEPDAQAVIQVIRETRSEDPLGATPEEAIERWRTR
jgi:hypothetical protein